MRVSPGRRTAETDAASIDGDVWRAIHQIAAIDSGLERAITPIAARDWSMLAAARCLPPADSAALAVDLPLRRLIS